MEALQSIQAQLKAPKNQYNSFGKYKYRNCEDILEAVKPLLEIGRCTLVITDEVKEVAGIPYVEAKVIFSDGQNKIAVTAQAGIDVNRKGMDISQSFGSSSSYARKYALNGLFLINDTQDSDATNQHQSKRKTAKEELNPQHPKWEKAKKSLSKKQTTLIDIEKHFTITTQNKELLTKFN